MSDKNNDSVSSEPDDLQEWFGRLYDLGADQAKRILESGAIQRGASLKVELLLQPRQAEWILNKVVDRTYFSPSDALFHILTEYREIEPHNDIRQEVLRRSLDAVSLENTVPLEDVLKEFDKIPERHQPVEWKKEEVDFPVNKN